MDDFEALIRSFGEQLLDYVGHDRVRQIVVKPDEFVGAAHVEVCLRDDSYETVVHAIERIGQVRSMFIEELSFDYVLVEADGCTSAGEAVENRDLVFA